MIGFLVICMVIGLVVMFLPVEVEYIEQFIVVLIFKLASVFMVSYAVVLLIKLIKIFYA